MSKQELCRYFTPTKACIGRKLSARYFAGLSATTLTKEFQLAEEVFHLSFAEMEKLTITAMKSAFRPYDERIKYICDSIKPGLKKLREKYNI